MQTRSELSVNMF